MSHHWAQDAIFYHIYPLGFCGAPIHNDRVSPRASRLDSIYGWLDHLEVLGINALYLGPVFESSMHGYDTADYFWVDRRLGDNATLTRLVDQLHQRGIRVILDGVFNHVGRAFWAFRDVQEHGPQSAYCDWFQNLRFGESSPYGDPFCYEGWQGHLDLVKLDLRNPAVKQHLLQAVEMWIHEFHIDGLRLDATDCLDLGFIQELSQHCKHLRADFWLMGEVVHGDYRTWAHPGGLDSVTNYECYKGLYSSLVDKNYYEIAYALNRQFGENGMYQQLPLYNFADNHDVDRVASKLTKLAHLYPLYCLLFTMPGVPSIYYGSEWGLQGKKENGNDAPLRPRLDIRTSRRSNPQPELAKAIGRLARVRSGSRPLRQGDYQQLIVKHEQLAFARQLGEECVVVVVNAADEPTSLEIPVPGQRGNEMVDLLNPSEQFAIAPDRTAHIDSIWPNWARILAVR